MFELDDFDKEIGGLMCYHCRHYYEGGRFACAAFPDGIPDDVWHDEHYEPYPGDHGIQFEELSPEEMEERSKRMRSVETEKRAAV